MKIIVLRHADKLSPPDDGLKPQGIERAKLLARMLVDSGLTVAFCSEFKRTAQTLQPLQERLGSTLSVKSIAIDGPGGADAHVHDVVAAVKSLPAGTGVIIVTHSNTVDRIIKNLGGGTVEPLKETQFDKLFILFANPPGTAGLVKLNYGPQT
jgi:broad specificity phosphatase PhoE